MSSPNRRTLLLLPLALAACGFQPAYGPGGAAEGLKDQIRVADPQDAMEFDLVQRFEERLGRGRDGAFALDYTLTTTREEAGITTEGAITRYQLKGRIDWRLTDTASGAVVTSGRAESFTSWSATGSTVAALAAEEDAASRLMVILADQIVLALLASSADWLP